MTSILLIYTGGTIGMMQDHETGALKPFDFEHLLAEVPELKRFDVQMDVESYDQPVDSSDMEVSHWQRIAWLIAEKYYDYDGFVILHGTDTMAYTASALSFMLRDLGKPVILTGSQLPIGVLRTDGKENLISAIQLASMQKDDEPVLQEVAIYFGTELFRGNRTIKYSTEDFDAFESPNVKPLAEAGIHVFFDHFQLNRPSAPFELMPEMENKVAIVRVVPGLRKDVFEAILGVHDLKGVILETYGSGNALTSSWFLNAIQAAMDRGVWFLNVTQCLSGFVEQGKYETSSAFSGMGVIPGGDMTLEAAYAKFMHVLHYYPEEVEERMLASFCGEITTYSSLV